MKGCLETIRQDVEAIKNNQAKFKGDLKTFEKKLERTTESLNLKFDTLNGEVHVAMTRVDKLEDEVSKLATNVNQAYERLLSLERYSRDFQPTILQHSRGLKWQLYWKIEDHTI